MAILNVPIQIRTDSEQNWNSSILILKDGEPALCKKNDGTSELKFGDGQKTYKELPVFGKSWSKEQDNTDLLVILISIENNQADATYEEILSVITNKHNVAVLYNKDIYQLSKKDSNNISFICTKNSGRAILTLSSANTWTDSFENWSAEDISFKIGENQLASNVQEEIDKLKENPGATPTIAVGTVTTLDPGQDATAEITGETPNLTLNLGIPEGPPGQDGVQLNDSAINTIEAWSSKKIVDTLCPSFSVSGNPVMCNPVEDYPLSAVVTLEPKQAGSGDPSPENVRPISGYDSVTVTQSKDGSQVKQITLTLPETIYGGTVDAVTGVGEIQIAFMVLDGTENWVLTGNTSDKYQGFAMYIPYTNVNYSMLCSHFMYNPKENVANTCSQTNSGYSIRFVISTEIVPNKTVAEWKSYLAAQAAAGTPVTIVYKLATPEPFQATGNQALPAVAGLNTVYTDGNSLAVSGRSDPTAYIQQQINDAITAAVAITGDI